MNLIVIGNGFDLFHKLPTSYYHFKEFLVGKGFNEFVDLLERSIDGDLWSDFENALGELNFSEIDISADSYEEDDYLYEDDEHDLFEGHYLIRMADNMQTYFEEWINSINNPVTPILHEKIINQNQIILNFNYTDTVEKTYKIVSDKVLHIHGEAGKTALIVGHGNSFSGYDIENMPSTEYYDFIEEVEFQEIEFDSVIAKYYKKTYKDTARVIVEHDHFFKLLADIDEILILGHSLNGLDMGYFKEIACNIDSHVKWVVTYYKANEIDKFKNNLLSIGINEEQLVFTTMKDLNDFYAL